MPKVSHAHRESRRDQILDAALSCFAAQGFQTTSMNDIIEAAGLSAGAIYSYFPGKRDLALAVARRAVTTQAALVVGDVEVGPVRVPSEVVRGVGHGLQMQGVPTALLLQLWGEAATDPEFHAITAEVFVALKVSFRGYLEKWAVQSGNASVDEAATWADDVLPVMLGLGQGYIVQSAILPDFDPDRYIAGVARVLD